MPGCWRRPSRQQFQQPALAAWLQAAAQGQRRLRPTGARPAHPAGQSTEIADSAAIFYQANEYKPENLAGSASRLFLGVKLECAQCHNHPFDKWTRTQFWQFAGFFTDVAPGRPGAAETTRGDITIPGQDKVVPARFLDGKEPQWKDEIRTRPTLAEWMTAADNPYFARAIVNRLWTYFFGSRTRRPGRRDERRRSRQSQGTA